MSGSAIFLKSFSDFFCHLSHPVDSISDDSLLFLWNYNKNRLAVSGLESRIIDLRHFSIFLKNKNFQEFVLSVGDKNLEILLAKYEKEKQTVFNHVKAYLSVGIDIGKIEDKKLIPGFLLSSCAELHSEILSGLKDFLYKKHLFKEIIEQDYARYGIVSAEWKESPIKTPEGISKLNLEYTSNFRYKASGGSLNVFNMPKEERRKLLPLDDDSFIFAVDYRQFEVRTFLAETQFKYFDFVNEDIYEHVSRINNCTRDEAKVAVISFLYGANSSIFPGIRREDILAGMISEEVYFSNILGLRIPVSANDKNKVHTITQTISQIVCAQKINKLHKLLENTKSSLIYPFHDCMIFSINKKEAYIMKDIVQTMEDDIYKTKSYAGKDYGNIKEIDLGNT